MKNLEHIGIAVKDFAAANALFTKLLNAEPYKMEEVLSEGVNTSFFRMGEAKIELLEGLTPDSAITKFLEKKGEGIHHLAFEVNNLESSLAEYEQKGFNLINKEPKLGADNKRIAFLHPNDPEMKI